MDLNDFVATPSPFLQLLAAYSINDAGEIIGSGVTQSGEIHAFLATPNRRAFVRQEAESKSPWSPDAVRTLLREGLRLGRFSGRGIGAR